MPISRKPAASAPEPEDHDEDDYTTEEPEEEAPKRRGLGKRVSSESANAAFKKGAAEGKPTRARKDEDEDDEDEDDDEDDGSPGAVQSGWAAARRAKAAGSGFAEEFKFEQDESLVKFAGDEPFAVYAQHWIESGLKSTKKKSFICLGKKKGCPLCALGDNPRPMFAFNIAVIDEDGEVSMKALLAGTRLLGQIEQAHASKSGPLSKNFWALSRTGKKSATAYTLAPVKARDLKEDWQVELDDIEEQLEELKPYTADAYKPMTKAQLREIADELAEDED